MNRKVTVVVPIYNVEKYIGKMLDLISIYTIVGGLAFLFVFAFHGAAFLTMRLADKSLILRVQDVAKKAGALAVIFFVLCMALTYVYTDLYANPFAAGALVLAAVVFLASYANVVKKATTAGFVCSGLAVALTVVAFFLGLFPRLMVSSLSPEYSLTIYNASSTPYTLSIMTIAAGCLVPIILGYQIWSYYIFRKRVTTDDLGHY